MVTANFACTTCPFISEEFVVGYYPPSDCYDVVFQNKHNSNLRIVTLENLTTYGDVQKFTTEQFYELLSKISSEVMEDNEVAIDTWRALEEIKPLECPDCHNFSVKLKISALI